MSEDNNIPTRFPYPPPPINQNFLNYPPPQTNPMYSYPPPNQYYYQYPMNYGSNAQSSDYDNSYGSNQTQSEDGNVQSYSGQQYNSPYFYPPNETSSNYYGESSDKSILKGDDKREPYISENRMQYNSNHYESNQNQYNHRVPYDMSPRVPYDPNRQYNQSNPIQYSQSPMNRNSYDQYDSTRPPSNQIRSQFDLRYRSDRNRSDRKPYVRTQPIRAQNESDQKTLDKNSDRNYERTYNKSRLRPTKRIRSRSRTPDRNRRYQRYDSNSKLKNEKSERDIILERYRKNYCATTEDVSNKLEEYSKLSQDEIIEREKSIWTRTTPADLYYVRDDENPKITRGTSKLLDICERFKYDLVDRAQRINSTKPKYEPPQRKKPIRVCKHKCKSFKKKKLIYNSI